MEEVWLASALWIGLALAASLISIWFGISVALIEIVVGAVAGNLIGLTLAPWVNYLAGFGRPLRHRVALAAGADRRPVAVDHVGGGGLRGHGGDRAQ